MSDFDDARAELRKFERLGTQARYDEMNRLWLLAVHVAIGLGVTLCFLYWQIPLTWQASIGSSGFFPIVCAVAPGVGAAILAAGLAMHRKLILEGIGMGIMALWDLAGVVMVLRYVHHPTVPTAPPLEYQMPLYAGLGALMFVHLVTLRIFYKRQQRARV